MRRTNQRQRTNYIRRILRKSVKHNTQIIRIKLSIVCRRGVNIYVRGNRVIRIATYAYIQQRGETRHNEWIPMLSEKDATSYLSRSRMFKGPWIQLGY